MSLSQSRRAEKDKNIDNNDETVVLNAEVDVGNEETKVAFVVALGANVVAKAVTTF